jgi:hypothetical protein
MNALRRSSFLLAAVAALGIGLAGAGGAHADDGGGASFALQPVTFDRAQPATQSYFIFDSRPGVTIDSQVRVSNRGDAAGTVRLYGVDATTGQTSGTVFLAREAPKQDVGGWLTLEADELTLTPGESRAVPFRVRVPADAWAGQHVGGIVAENEQLQQPAGGGALNVQVQHLTIDAVQVNLPGGAAEKLEATGVGAGGGGGYQTLLLGLQNSGDLMLKPEGQLTVRDAQGTVLQDLPLKLDTLLPRTAIDYPVAVQRQALSAGDYRAALTLRYGSGGQLSVTLPLTITPAQAAQVFQGSGPLAPPSKPATASTSPASRTTSNAVLPILIVTLGIAVAAGTGAVIQIRRQRHAV